MLYDCVPRFSFLKVSRIFCVKDNHVVKQKHGPSIVSPWFKESPLPCSIGPRAL